MRMLEYVLWANCTNKCKFCPQSITSSSDKDILTKEEKLQVIQETIDNINKINNTSDILIIGGELYGEKDPEIQEGIKNIWLTIKNKIIDKKIRYFYTNSNLIFEGLDFLHELFNIFRDMPDNLKFATSYDIGGRYNDDTHKAGNTKATFKNNLWELCHIQDRFKIVLNIIMTHQFYRVYVEGIPESEYTAQNFDDTMYASTSFSLVNWMQTYGLAHIHLLPYIKADCIKTDVFDTNTVEICKILEKAESEIPGYIQQHIAEFDNGQLRVCYQYIKGKGYIENTAQKNQCYHNINFTKVLETGECYICKLKELFNC